MPKSDIVAAKDIPSFQIPGLPHIVDYHILNNKRFVLTKDSVGTIQLWQLDICKCIHTFNNQTWDATKKLLSETYDLTSGKSPLP